MADLRELAPQGGRRYSYSVPPKVLIVDDELDIRQAVAELLSDEGYQVLVAGDGAEALAYLREFHPQLVLLDLMMPGMNGWQFRAAQKHDPDPECSSVPVVVLSALERDAHIDADAYMQKPFGVDDLLSTVHRLTPYGAGGAAHPH
jgi:CheY-like chemotaxis protein